MLAGNLDTTNLLLGIMAATSVLQVLLLIGVAVGGVRLYRQTVRTIRELDERRITPLGARVDLLMTKMEGILTDVKAITTRVSERTERVDSAIRHTMDRVDETADRVRSSVASRVSRIIGLVNGARSMVDTFFNGRRSSSDASPPTSVM